MIIGKGKNEIKQLLYIQEKFEHKGAVQQNFKENTGLWGEAEEKKSQEEQFKRQDCRKMWGWELGGGTRIKKKSLDAVTMV